MLLHEHIGRVRTQRRHNCFDCALVGIILSVASQFVQRKTTPLLHDCIGRVVDQR